MAEKTGFSLVEILIGILIFSIGLMLIFVIPSNIVAESKEIDEKISLYQIAINHAENLVSIPENSSKLLSGSVYEEKYFFNGATYTGRYEIRTTNIEVYKQSKVNDVLDTQESTTINMAIKYASVTFINQTNDYSVSFKVIPKN